VRTLQDYVEQCTRCMQVQCGVQCCSCITLVILHYRGRRVLQVQNRGMGIAII
jgi:hypothetical protein